MRALTKLSIVIVIASAVAAQARAGGPQYQIFDIGLTQPGDTAAQAFGVSPAGVAVGRSVRASGSQAYSWTLAGGIVGLPNLTGRIHAVSNSANDSGIVVGTASDTLFGSNRLPVMWQGGVVTQLTLPDGEVIGDATSVNAAGIAVGSVDGGSFQRGAVYKGPSSAIITETTPTGCFFVAAFGINNSARIVGFGIDPNNAARNVGIVFDLGSTAAFEVGAVPGANGAIAFAVGNGGHVVGSSMMNQGSGTPFIWTQANGIAAIPLAAGTSQGSARGVNSAGWVVGIDSSAFSIPFLWDGTTTYRIADLLPAGSGWDLSMNTSSSALGISDNGIIVGTGVHNGDTHAYAMVPVTSTPTPSPTATAVPTATPTGTPTPTATATATATATPTATPTATATPTPMATPTSTPTATPTPATQALNVSTRLRVQTGDNVGIAGFIITGTDPVHVLVRAIGPSLTQFGVPDALPDPVLELHGPGAFVTVTNNNWMDDPAQAALIIASGIPPTNNLESAIDAMLLPGAYTALVRGNNNASGVGLIEVYDLSHAVAAKLANISTRAFVDTGNNVVIAGFILGNNNGNDRIVVRGLGPSLTAVGVPNALADPTLELRDSNGALLVSNNDWQDNPAQAAELVAANLAPVNTHESGIAATLPPGLYTAVLAGRNNGTGVGLVEVYDRGGAPAHQKTNLVSDLPGLATFTDPNLTNPWGIATSATSPFWIANNRSGLSTIYNSSGTPQALVVTVPPAPGGVTGNPTGIVYNATNDFQVATGATARFIFATEDGTISGWSQAVGATAVLKVNNSASTAVYKGLAIGNNGTANYLYAANFHAGRIDVFDAAYAPATLSGTFADPSLPAGYAPFNIQNLGTVLYVTYALQDASATDDVPGLGHGYINTFDFNGNLLGRFASQGALNSPWGIAIAPAGFGAFANDLLVGNFGDGRIEIFDPATHAYLGQLADGSSLPISIEGLWGLKFGNGGSGGGANTLYFTAGIAGPGQIEDHGLFGSITAQ